MKLKETEKKFFKVKAFKIKLISYLRANVMDKSPQWLQFLFKFIKMKTIKLHSSKKMKYLYEYNLLDYYCPPYQI